MGRVEVATSSLAAVCLLCLLLASYSAEAAQSGGSVTSGGSGGNNKATQQRSSSAATALSLIGALGSLVPNLVTNVAPLVVLFGLGALMMPAFGMSAMGLLREARRSATDQAAVAAPNLQAAFAQYARPLQSSPQDLYYLTKRSFPSLMSNINTAGIMRGMQDLLERVAAAIENADKRYN